MSTAEPEDDEGLIEVRATVHLAGLNVGDPALVDPTDSYIADCLRGRILVPVEPDA